jgi:hypothetical protein
LGSSLSWFSVSDKTVWQWRNNFVSINSESTGFLTGAFLLEIVAWHLLRAFFRQTASLSPFPGAPCLSQTIRIPTSEGETPEIRDAWPNVGRLDLCQLLPRLGPQTGDFGVIHPVWNLLVFQALALGHLDLLPRNAAFLSGCITV